MVGIPADQGDVVRALLAPLTQASVHVVGAADFEEDGFFGRGRGRAEALGGVALEDVAWAAVVWRASRTAGAAGAAVVRHFEEVGCGGVVGLGGVGFRRQPVHVDVAGFVGG